MGVVPRVAQFQVGEAGSAAEVEGLPAMLLAQQPDTMIDAGVVGALTIRAASVRGAGHRYDATPRQDDFCLGTGGARGEFLVAAVADGVSAGPRSHLAARVAVRLGVQLLTQAMDAGPASAIDWDELVGTIAGHVLLQARKDRGDDGLDARGAAAIMASTAAFVIVPVERDPSGVRTCVVVPIGDTSVWVLRAGGTWESVTPVKNEGAAVASSAVFALPLLPATSIVPLSAVLAPGDALFVLTDGVGDPLGEGVGEVGRALATAWATPPNRYEFAAQVDLARRSHTDDRTAVGIWPDVVPADLGGVTLGPADGEPSARVDLAPPPLPPSADDAEGDAAAGSLGDLQAPRAAPWVSSASLPPSTRSAPGSSAAGAGSSSPYRSPSPYAPSSPYGSQSPYAPRGTDEPDPAAE